MLPTYLPTYLVRMRVYYYTTRHVCRYVSKEIYIAIPPPVLTTRKSSAVSGLGEEGGLLYHARVEKKNVST